MCFSAPASFALSGILTGVGAASIRQSSSNARRLFAAIPLLFAAQQAAEGTVWLTVGGNPESVVLRVAVYAFLGFALVVWPVWCPLALQRVERDPVRRRILTALIWFGAAVAASAAFLLSRWQPVAVVVEHSIRYDRAGTSSAFRDFLVLLAYALSTIVPFLVSSAQLARTIGLAIVLSLTATALIERNALTSVWCFFAAILSVLILVAVRREEGLLRAANLQHVAAARA
jgi:hypothetical protein